MATKKKAPKTKKPRASVKAKASTAKKQARPAVKASAKKKAPKKSNPSRPALKSRAAAAGASRGMQGMQGRYSGKHAHTETDTLELESPELDFEMEDAGDDAHDEIMPPEYGGEN